ncbi:MAG: VWA domain-containing protein [Acidobacteria bacterium]|nr:VWA domain-containing protein [Acidobacteriota bacterium]
MRRKVWRVVAANCAIALTALWWAACLRPVQAQEEKKREKLGSSLKRLKWDEQKGAAVEKTKKEPERKPAAAADPDVLRIETPLAVFDLLVVDRHGRVISGLTKDDFVVAEDGVRQQVSTFSLGDNVEQPRSIVLIIDYSSSQLPFLKTSIAAAKTLVEQLGPKDKMAVVTDDVSLLLDFTSDKTRLKAGLDLVLEKPLRKNAYGRSEQYTALLAVLREMASEEERPIVIFQTDGDQLTYLRAQDDGRRYKRSPKEVEFGLADVVAAAQRSHTTIYSVISGIRFLDLAPSQKQERAKRLLESRSSYTGVGYALFLERATENTAYLESLAEFWTTVQAALANIASGSGGWHEFLEWPEQAAGIYTKILNDINRRYIIGYSPTNDARDGKLRKVQFEVRGHPEYVVVGRRSYYAPAQ